MVTALEVTGLSKSFGDARALENADLVLRQGEIHAIVGENGAGKSTLVKCLAGMVVPDAGEVSVRGALLSFGNSRASREAGISTSFQELSLLSNLTVGENLLIAELPTRLGIVGRRSVARRAKEVLDEWEVPDLDPDMLVEDLPLSAKQRLETLRAMYVRPSLLILDEPTAALPDTDWLFAKIRELVRAGTTVLYISHKLGEIRELCDRGTVLRNGEVVGSFDDSNFDANSLISMMIGRSIELVFPARQHELPPAAPTVLQTRGMAVGTKLRGVDLDIREGEIVGVAALEGQGQRALFYGLAGAGPITGGTVTIDGRPYRAKTPRAALNSGRGIALVPEERKIEGLFADLSTVQNITSTALDRVTSFGLVRGAAEVQLAAGAGADAQLPAEFLAREVGQLSGGNQQKTVLARTALSGARVLLMFDPTRGIDPSAKLEVYNMLRRASAQGIALVFYSTEIPELVGLSDRVVVLYNGRIAAELTGEAIREDHILAAAVGHGGEIADGPEQAK